MPIRFVNDSVKTYLAQKGVPSVFGREVDIREKLSGPEAIAWFDRVWESQLAKEVEKSDECDLDFVRSNVLPQTIRWLKPNATYRCVRLANCLFIAQLIDPESCDQLWFILSSSGDPRSLFVKFPTMAEKEAFDKKAHELGWKSEELGLKILTDFLDTVSRKKFGPT
jgi:hypothetical protein